MIAKKYKLGNGNTLIWFGNQPICGCENVLILAGKEVLFLKTVKQVSIGDIREDMETLGRTKFFKEYDWPQNSSGYDLYRELKDKKEYPPE